MIADFVNKEENCQLQPRAWLMAKMIIAVISRKNRERSRSLLIMNERLERYRGLFFRASVSIVSHACSD